MLIGKNKRKMGKKALCLIFAFLLSINSFAAIVSDNDGSAFVTKAEFDSLKKNFADQIDNYNDSIDAKIDGAIASYLAGIQLEKKIVETDLLTPLSNNYYFDSNYKIPPTKIGDYGKYWCKIAVLLDRGNGGDYNNNGNMEYNAGTVNHGSPQWVTPGTSDNQSTFLMFLKDDTYSGKIDTAYVLKSQPFTMYAISGAHSAWPYMTSITGFKRPANFDGTKGSLTEWGSWTTSLSVDAWAGVSTIYNQAYASVTVGSVDTTADTSTWDKYSLPGGNAFTDRQLHSIELKDINLIGNQRSTRYTAATGLVANPHISYRKNTASSMVVASSWDLTWLGFYLYDHKYVDTYYTRDINLVDVSAVASSFTTYGDGLPIFRSSQKGKVKFVLNTGAMTGTKDNPGFEISKAKFANRNMNSNPFATFPANAEHKITEKGTSGSNNKYELEFDVEDDTVYWIVAKPTTSSKVYLKIEGDIVNTSDT